jgi:fatty acid desaturase
MDGPSLPHSRGNFAASASIDQEPSGQLVVAPRSEWAAKIRRIQLEEPSELPIARYCWAAAAGVVCWLGIAAIIGHFLAGVLIFGGALALLGLAVVWGYWVIDNTIEL